MPEETKHGTPTPPDPNRDGRGLQIECAEFEALLSDAIDGNDGGSHGGGQLSLSLSPARREMFDSHRRVCAVCGPLFADVQAGQHWLRSLEAVEPPAYLVHNILAATTGVVSTRTLAAMPGGRTTPFAERAREWWDSFITPVRGFVRQPRFVMSFGMIFFSFSLALSAAGVKPRDVAKVDLRPAALRHAYNDAEIKVVKYYDNIRFVYEIESKLRELKRTSTPAEPSPAEPKQNHKNDTSGQPDRVQPDRVQPDHVQPDQRQDRNYSQEYNQPVLAALRARTPSTPLMRDGVGDAVPAMTVITNRRFV
jgi:hypothetical protein